MYRTNQQYEISKSDNVEEQTEKETFRQNRTNLGKGKEVQEDHLQCRQTNCPLESQKTEYHHSLSQRYLPCSGIDNVLLFRPKWTLLILSSAKFIASASINERETDS